MPPWVKPEQPVQKDGAAFKTFTEPIVLKNKADSQIPAIYILTVDAAGRRKPTISRRTQSAQKCRGWTVTQLLPIKSAMERSRRVG